MRLAALIALAVAAALAACGGEDDQVEGPLPSAPDRIELTSTAFDEGGTIPPQFTCDGDDDPPPLAWSGVPRGADSLALLVEDPDAPGGSYVHWTVFDLNTGIDSIGGGAPLPQNTKEGNNSGGDTGYKGPCPPQDDAAHRYQFALYALTTDPPLDNGASPDDVRNAIERTAVARGVLNGKFGR